IFGDKVLIKKDSYKKAWIPAVLIASLMLSACSVTGDVKSGREAGGNKENTAAEIPGKEEIPDAGAGTDTDASADADAGTDTGADVDSGTDAASGKGRENETTAPGENREGDKNTASGEGNRNTASGEIGEDKETTASVGTNDEADSPAGRVAAAEEPAPADTVRIVMTGDVLMHDRIIAAGKNEDGTYDYSRMFENVRGVISAADIAIVNQETILGGVELGLSGYPSFNSPYEVGDAEAEAGFDVILHGTNHALDRSFNGIRNCVSFWEEKHPEITYLGIHDDKEDTEDIFVTECKGIKIAILNYTYGTNGIRPPEGREYIVDMLKEDRVISDLDRAEEMADITVVCPHWGEEYSLGVSDEQRRWTDIFLEHGADLVIGTHPHVIEPFETVGNGNDNMLVYYSIGNFINATSGEGAKVTPRMVGGIAEAEIKKNENGEAFICANTVIPIVCHLTKDDATVYYMNSYTEEMASENRIVKQNPEFSLESCRDVVREVWGSEYAE
nr:CapA family protein [Lachnospiraceae bacterium]